MVKFPIYLNRRVFVMMISHIRIVHAQTIIFGVAVSCTSLTGTCTTLLALKQLILHVLDLACAYSDFGMLSSYLHHLNNEQTVWILVILFLSKDKATEQPNQSLHYFFIMSVVLDTSPGGHFGLLCPPPPPHLRGEWGHIDVDAESVCVGVGVGAILSCLNNIW